MITQFIKNKRLSRWTKVLVSEMAFNSHTKVV